MKSPICHRQGGAPTCTTLRVVSWIVGFIVTYSARALRISLMPRAGPLRAIKNPSDAYKAIKRVKVARV